MFSMKSKGFETFQWGAFPSETSKRSAQYLMYVAIKDEFIPIKLQGRASLRKAISISTASEMILRTVSGCARFLRWLKRRQAKSV